MVNEPTGPYGPPPETPLDNIPDTGCLDRDCPGDCEKCDTKPSLELQVEGLVEMVRDLEDDNAYLSARVMKLRGENEMLANLLARTLREETHAKGVIAGMNSVLDRILMKKDVRPQWS